MLPNIWKTWLKKLTITSIDHGSARAVTIAATINLGMNVTLMSRTEVTVCTAR